VPETAHQNGAHPPASAKLVGVLDKIEFRIDPDKPTMIGRGSTRNNVNLSNPTVSRHHAQIAYEAGHYVLTALRDLNGTFVNDTLVRKRPLQDGDEVRFGRSRFYFSVMESEYGA
jgi:pSer/pThr/pTyr-binding forkhead associated (FHA) protein